MTRAQYDRAQITAFLDECGKAGMLVANQTLVHRFGMSKDCAGVVIREFVRDGKLGKAGHGRYRVVEGAK
jgi:hypothetical protein